jgi:hypothetical protein
VKVRPCALRGQFNFAGDKLLTTPNPDVNDDKMFEMLGLTPQKPFTKVSQPTTVECELSIYHSWKTKMNQDTLLTKIFQASAKENNFILIKKTHVKTEWVLCNI